MDEVRSAEWMTDSQRLRDELGELDATQSRAILWGLRRNPAAMNGLRQQAKRAARGFRTAANQPTSTPSPTCVWASSPISPSPHLPVSPFMHAVPLPARLVVHRMCCQRPLERK